MIALVLAATLSFGPEIPVAPVDHAPAPMLERGLDVATDGRDFFAVWNDARGARGARFTGDGALLDPNGIVLNAPVAGVIWTGTHYLAVSAPFELYAQTVTRDGEVGPAYRIGGLEGIRDVSLATNGSTVAITVNAAQTFIVTTGGFLLHDVRTGDGEASFRSARVAPLRDGYVVVTDDGVRVMKIDANGNVSTPRRLEDSDDRRAIAVATNGDTPMVAWSDGHRIRTQRLTSDGEPAAPAQDVAVVEQFDWSSLVLTPRESDFLLTYGASGQNHALRIRRTGVAFGAPQPFGSKLGPFGASVRVIARPDGMTAFVWVEDGTLVASFIPTWPPLTPIAPQLTVAMSPRMHTSVALAASADHVLHAWVEQHGSTSNVRLGIVGSPDAAVVHTSNEPFVYLVGLAIDNGTVWVVWTENFELRVRRFTTQLHALDVGTTQAGGVGNYRSVTIGNGVVLVTSWFGDVAATLLRGRGQSIEVQRLVLDQQRVPGIEVATAAAWDGEAFVVAYAHANESFPFELRAERISASGTRLDAQPNLVAMTDYVDWVRAARVREGVALLWDDSSHPVSGALYRNSPRPAVRTVDEAAWCSEPALVPDGDGFVIARGACDGRRLFVERYTSDFARRERQELIAFDAFEPGLYSPRFAMTDDLAVIGYVRWRNAPPFDGLGRAYLRTSPRSIRRRSVGR